MAAVLSQNRRNVLIVLDPWEVRVALVAPVATIRTALLRERPTVVATNRLWSWLRRAEIDVIPVGPVDSEVPRSELPELRRFAGTRHERLIGSAIAIADQALTQALHEQLVSQNRSRQASVVAEKNVPSRSASRLSVPHRE